MIPSLIETWVRSLTKGSPTPNQLDSVRDNVRLCSFLQKRDSVMLIDWVFDHQLVRRGSRIVFRLPCHIHEISNADRRSRRDFPFPRRAVFTFYSIVIVLWATFFAEYWAVCERKLAVRWGSYGSSGVNKSSKNQATRRNIWLSRWWIAEDFWKLSRLGASVAVLLGFMCVLVAIAVVIFSFGSLSGDIIQGSRKPACGRCANFFRRPEEELTSSL
jgi:hypothetical protein